MSYLNRCDLISRVGDLPTDLLPKVKDYLQVDFVDDDTLILELIKQAIAYVERYSNRAIWRAEYESYYTNETDNVRLFFADKISLTGDSDDKYTVVQGNTIKTSDKEVSITHESGYTISDLPEWALTAICTNVAFRYEKRGDDFPNMHIDIHTKEFLKPFVDWIGF